MERDKAKDDKFFNCYAEHEINYVAGLYPNRVQVKEFLFKKCREGAIKYATHIVIYQLIEKDLGYSLPN
jgi:hypothetical protein